MGYNLKYDPKFKIEVVEIYDWYFKEGGETLALTFLDKMMEAIQFIERNPLSMVRYKTNIHKINLRTFPYKILFKVNKNDVIVLAIFHHKRNRKR